MIIHSVCMSEVSKDLSGFRHLFVKSISSTLRISSGSVDIVDVTKGSIVVEFLIWKSRRGDDLRDSRDLVVALAQELGDPKSGLRKGPFARYAAGAELVSGQSRRTAVPLRALGDGSTPLCCDQASQHTDLAAILADVLVQVEVERKRVEAAEHQRREALEEMRRLDLFVNEMHQLEDLRRNMPLNRESHAEHDHLLEQQRRQQQQEQQSLTPVEDDLDCFAAELRMLREGSGGRQALSDSGQSDEEATDEESEAPDEQFQKQDDLQYLEQQLREEEPASREERQLEDFTEDLVTTCLDHAGGAIPYDEETTHMNAAAWARERDEEELNKEEMCDVVDQAQHDILQGLAAAVE